MAGSLFERPKKNDKDLIHKVKSAQPKKTKSGNVVARIQDIISTANAKLNKYKNDYIIIKDENELQNYISKANSNGLCSIDTETTGLNPMTVDIVGVCLYTPNQKSAYIPIGHISYITGQKTGSQLSKDVVKSELEKFTGKWIMHNAKYDIRVLRHTMNLYLECYWDTVLAGFCIDENESHRLKDLHLKYCDSKDKESLTFDKLFNGVSFDLVPISTAYLYAAGDAIKTFDVYEYQKSILERDDMKGPYNIFKNIEMPLITVCADMEDRGVCLDLEMTSKLKEKYHKMKDEQLSDINKILEKYDSRINQYKLNNTGVKLDDPINVGSPSQLATLFYDILGLESPDKKKPRGTGEDILKYFAKNDEEKDLCNAILDIRGTDKLLSTYIDKMPEIVHTDGRVHCNYNQYGAKTGRFSSSDPNMQNIPSHNKEIRTMFKAQDGFIMVGADYSQQEPFLTSYLSQDKKMMQSFIDGRDIYSTISSLAFHTTYEECLEHFPKDSPIVEENKKWRYATEEEIQNKSYTKLADGENDVYAEGKGRRTQAKSIVLGILYGRQIPSIAEQLNVTNKEAQEIYNAVLKAFPQLAEYIDKTQEMAREKGYVTTAWGRRRHIPDMQLDKYSFKYSSNNARMFDPLNFSRKAGEVPIVIREKYMKELNNAYGWQNKNQVIQNAERDGIKITDNTGFIAQAERQCVNSTVQGSAADCTKLAMIQINNDEQMKKLDAHLIIQVHDEVIVECPEENQKEVAERLSYLMRTAPTDLIDLPFKCDCDFMKNWYMKGDENAREATTARQLENELKGT